MDIGELIQQFCVPVIAMVCYCICYAIKRAELIKDKTPDEISKIKILDPACGSGSFLLEAYQQLLDYNLNYYINNKSRSKEFIHKGRDGEWRLRIEEKKRILLRKCANTRRGMALPSKN